MKVGQSVKYKTKGGCVHKITHFEEGRFSIGFDECSSLEDAKRTLEWIDNPNRVD